MKFSGIVGLTTLLLTFCLTNCQYDVDVGGAEDGEIKLFMKFL
jgi:hypothetical protein